MRYVELIVYKIDLYQVISDYMINQMFGELGTRGTRGFKSHLVLGFFPSSPNIWFIMCLLFHLYFRLFIILLLVSIKSNRCVAMIYFSFSLKDYLEKNDSASESVVWEFLVDLSLVSMVQIDKMLWQGYHRSGNDPGKKYFSRSGKRHRILFQGKLTFWRKVRENWNNLTWCLI